MTDSGRTGAEERVRKAIASLPPVQADRTFRERLRAEFVSGRIDATPAGDRARVPSPASETASRSRRRRPFFSWSGLAPAAAAVAVVLVVWGTGLRSPELDVIDVRGEGSVLVDGRSVPVSDRETLRSALHPGARVELPDGLEIALRYGRTVAYELAPGSRSRIPGAPGGWLRRRTSGELALGELRVLTGPDFRGGRLLVETPEGRIAVTSTLLSVFRNESLTCVCVHEGVAEVGVSERDMERVPAGRRKVMFASGEPALVSEIELEHDAHLAEFEARVEFP